MTPLNQIWQRLRNQYRENSVTWGTLTLFFLAMATLVVMMVSYAHAA